MVTKNGRKVEALSKEMLKGYSFSMDQKPLADRAALITGASRGIGKGVAINFAEAGADVLLSARSMADLEETAAEARKHGVRAETVYMDSYDLDSVNAAVDAVTERFGKIDVLVNNAGGSRNVDGGWLGFRESTPRIVRELFELNVFSPYFAAQRAAEAMIRTGARRLDHQRHLVAGRLPVRPYPAVQRGQARDPGGRPAVGGGAGAV